MQNENRAKVDDWDCKSSPPVNFTSKTTLFSASNLVASALAALLVLAGTSNAKAVCLPVPGDLNGNGSANVVDVQCAILVSLWALDGMVAAQPECLAGGVENGDTNCDGETNVVDVQITIQYSLSQPLSPEIDANQNGCPDTCEAESCGNGVCAADGSETCVSCPADCGPCTGACCEAHGGLGCEDAGITACVCAADAFCCDVAWDSTCAGEVESLGCGDCPAPPGDCCVAGEGAGCTNAACEACVCAADPFCCDVQWDDLCAGTAASNCQADCACPIPASCCEAHDAPGCDNAACEGCVCALDPFCCDTAWDGICVGEAQVDCAADCSCPITSDCCTTPGDVPGCGPGNTACEDCVCALDPFCCDTAFDQLCVDAANGADCGTACGCVATNPCLDFGVSQACCDTICAVDPFCCETAFDTICQDELTLCGNPTCCETGSDTPGCGDADCEACVCAADPFCCDTAWDATCVGEANDPALCGSACNCVAEVCGNGTCGTGEDCANCPGDCGPCPNACIDFGIDPACCDTICAVDPFCCETAFDTICEGELSLCGPPNPCLDAGVSQACCDTVCAVDPFCCETAFDATCEGEAADLCGGSGNPVCCETGGDVPGCGDANCEACVCALDPFCCDTSWDGICVGEAQADCQLECGCVAPPVVSDCCTTVGEVPGCGPGNTACESCVCALDAFCCDTMFDQLCVDAANGADCGIACGCTEVQSDCCTTTSGLTGCTDPTCEACVCALDSFCCDTSWDSICVGEAQNDCAADCNCPAVSDCCTTIGDGPGCGPGNIACEDCVCALDPFCCDTAFDQLCVDAANGADCGAACGCIATNACIDFGVDPACCDTICAVDPFCCETSFDSICQDELSLCGPPNPCLDAGVSQACCDTVCAVDPFCCETAFDATCEGEAADLCGGSGNPVCCETGGDVPGCGDANCEACVCALDSFCCTTSWDGICVGEAQADCQLECGCVAPPVVSDCCTIVGEVPGCGPGNTACESCVCALDAFCCDTMFDQLCVDAANGADCGIACGCTEVQSDCCTTTSGLTGCTDPTCEACVCAFDSFCCDTSWDSICVGEAQNECATDCNCPAVSDCCTTIGDGPGCGPGNIACEDCVCAIDAFCCETAFDQLCVDAANGPDCGAACGCIQTNACIDFGVDPACCDTICAVDPFCCETSFDSICQDELSLCGPPNPCLDAGVSQACCDTVCAVDPFCCETAFDATCEGEAADLCGGSGNPVCCETGGDVPGCGDANCEACVCALDGFCCDTSWDSICVGEAQADCQLECGCVAPPVVSDCCTTVGEVPGCGPGNTACESCVCALDAFCCDTMFDQLCVDAANGADCGIACGCTEVQSDCCTTTSGLTGCTDPTCEACVCALDSFCCTTSWDGLCVGEAQNECAADCNCPAVSDCCTTIGDGPGCGPGNIACEDCVCALDPFCCDTAFDQLCVDAANGADCGAACGCIATNACIDFGIDPACCDTICAVDAFCCDTSFDSICQDELSLCAAPNPCTDFGVDPACCDTICAVDPFCCESAFDLTCEGELSLCEGTGSAICCETGQGTPGCGDANCEACVCALDSFCCNTSWDGLCVDQANNACLAACGCSTAPEICGNGTCGTGEDCANCPSDCGPCGNACIDFGIDPACCDTICAVDPFCCDTSFDSICEGELSLCVAPNPCTDFGVDPACCDTICAVDPFCCETAFDATCEGELSLCVAANPCIDFGVDPGCCDTICAVDPFCCETAFDATCEGELSLCAASNPCLDFGVDPACCDTICAVDAFCCETSFDGICQQEQIDLCGGSGEVCGNGTCGTGEDCANCPGDCGPCSNPCLDAGQTQACCDTVCAVDAFCCDTSWDQICADEAIQLCGGGTGSAVCCSTGQSTPGCGDATCEGCVCALDAFCCETSWDGICVQEATDPALCASQCGCDGSGGTGSAICCSTGQGTPGCGDANCEACVCGVDAFCCDTAWDSICVGEATDPTLCASQCGCQ